MTPTDQDRAAAEAFTLESDDFVNEGLLAAHFARHAEAARREESARIYAIDKSYTAALEVVADLSKELDRQANEAWMRGDIQTADRLAKLIGAKSPLQCELEYIAECKAKEAAERQPESNPT